LADYFLDTSAVVKRYVQETGTAWIRTLVASATGHFIDLARITEGADRQGLITTHTAPAEARRLGPEGGEWYETAEQYYPYLLNFQKN